MPRVYVSITDSEHEILQEASDLTGYSLSSVAAILLADRLTRRSLSSVVTAVCDADGDDSFQLSLEGLSNDGRTKKRRV